MKTVASMPTLTTVCRINEGRESGNKKTSREAVANDPGKEMI